MTEINWLSLFLAVFGGSSLLTALALLKRIRAERRGAEQAKADLLTVETRAESLEKHGLRTTLEPCEKCGGYGGKGSTRCTDCFGDGFRSRVRREGGPGGAQELVDGPTKEPANPYLRLVEGRQLEIRDCCGALERENKDLKADLDLLDKRAVRAEFYFEELEGAIAAAGMRIQFAEDGSLFLSRKADEPEVREHVMVDSFFRLNKPVGPLDFKVGKFIPATAGSVLRWEPAEEGEETGDGEE